MREHGRNAIWVASDLLRGEKSRDLVRRSRSSTRWACTPARRPGSFTPRAGSARESAWRAATAKWTARASWACCCWPRRRAARITITADGADEDEALAALCALGRARIRRGGAMRMTGLGVSPGIGIGKALVLHARRPAICASGSRERRVERELERLDAARAPVARPDPADQGAHRRSRPAPSTPTSSTRSC